MDTGPPARVGTPISPGLCSPLCPHAVNCGAATHCGTCSRAETQGVFTEQDSEVKADAEVERPGGLGGEGSQGPQCLAASPRGPAGGAVGTPPFTQTLSWRGGSGCSMEMGREGVGTGGRGPRGERPPSWPGRWVAAPVLKRPRWKPSAGASLQLSS